MIGDQSCNENDVFGEVSNDIVASSSACHEEPYHRSLRPRKSSEILDQTELTRKVELYDKVFTVKVELQLQQVLLSNTHKVFQTK